MELDLAGIGGPLPVRFKRQQSLDFHQSEDRSKTPQQDTSLGECKCPSRDPAVANDLSDSDPEEEDVDIDLENTASIALSLCFGVTLDRLLRPIRVLDAFSGFKDRCAEILQEDENFRLIDWDDDGFSCFDVEETPPAHDAHPPDKTSNGAQRSTPPIKKRLRGLEDEGDEFDSLNLDPN